MIQLKELRIGNWIQCNKRTVIHKKEIPFFIKKETMGFLCSLSELCNLEDYDYIELTPKILEKFEFENNSFGRVSSIGGIVNIFFINYHTTTNKITFNLIFEKEKINQIKISKNSKVINIKPFKYIHQLQNLFYSLTGIELNNIVAYKYYSKLFLECVGFDLDQTTMTFENFLKRKESNNEIYSLEVKGKYPNYKLGDLPPNLFSND